MVEEHQHLDMGITCGGREERLGSDEARQQVVETGRRHEFVTSSDDGAALGVVEHDVPSVDRCGVDVELIGHEAGERTLAFVADLPDRCEVLLGVELQPVLADLAVEVDGELRDPQDGSVDEQQTLFDSASAADRDPTREAEVTVEPRVQQRAAVHLDPDLSDPGR